MGCSCRRNEASIKRSSSKQGLQEEEVLCGNSELASLKRGGGVSTVRGQVEQQQRRRDLPGLRWQLPAAAGKPMDPQRRINFAVNCFSHFRGLARFQEGATNREEYLETEDKVTV